MPRIVGVDIPDNKVTWVALQYIHGIGKKTALDLCESLGLDPTRRARELNDEELARLANEIESNFVVEGNLRRQTQQNVSRLKEIACYRGMRHRRGLPVRGQRTQTNAREYIGIIALTGHKRLIPQLHGIERAATRENRSATGPAVSLLGGTFRIRRRVRRHLARSSMSSPC